MDRSRIAIVIPALNEGATIETVVSYAASHGSPLVVDDGSTDRTGERAAAAGASVVRHLRNRGYDEALNSGAARAAELGHEFFITMDADGQHDASILTTFVKELESGADIVVGERDRRQRLSETVFACVAHARWGIKDPLCGMKGYRMWLYRAHGAFDTYGSIGTELMLYAARCGARLVQVPVKTAGRQGTPRFGRRWSANMKILRACWLGMRQSPAVVRRRA